eukprot:c18728_g1_i2 orf=198-1742(+)
MAKWGNSAPESDYDPGCVTLNELTDDALASVLSFLSFADILAVSCVNRRLRELCREERKVWVAMCERRWGKLTNLMLWSQAPISFRLLYMTLGRWENLIGFWRGVGNRGWGSLVLFVWSARYIIGYKIVPAGTGSYGICKVPFLWMGISSWGQPMCLIDPAFKPMGSSNDVESRSSDGRISPYDSFPSTSGFDKTVSINSTLGRGISSLDMDSEQLISLGLLAVDVHFVGNHHVVIEEMQQRRSHGINVYAEAATLASFGSGCNSVEMLIHRRCPNSSGSDSDSPVGSHSGSFQFEMYEFLTCKVTSPGGYRAARKQRKREKERALSQGGYLSLSEHFVKVIHCHPTKARPLQGLWKGIFDSTGLSIILVSYDDQGGILCRKIHEVGGVPESGSVLWTSKSISRIGLPLPPEEFALYNSRMHIRPIPSPCIGGKIQGDLTSANNMEPGDLVGEEVIGMLYTFSCDFHYRLSSDNREGRIWQYASGNFGFGFLHTNSIIDFRLLCSRGHLLDAVN